MKLYKYLLCSLGSSLLLHASGQTSGDVIINGCDLASGGYTCADPATNLYGVFQCDSIQQSNSQSSYPATIVYSKRGLAVDYSSLSCGNLLPIAPYVLANGALEWNQRIEYGTIQCVNGGRTTLTKDNADGTEWEILTVAAVPSLFGVDIITSVGSCTYQPSCTPEEILADNLPNATALAEDEPLCQDLAGNPYGHYTGIMTQSNTGSTYPVDIVYNETGVWIDYPTLSCGNRLPIIPTVVRKGTMELNERIEYGVRSCVQGGRIAITELFPGTWEIFWTLSDGDDVTSIGRLELDPEQQSPSCSATEAPVDVDIDPQCQDESGAYYGTWSGIVYQSDTGNSYPVSMQYITDGIKVDYPTLGCGNSDPIVPATTDGSKLEFTEILDYGTSVCVQGGSVTVSLVEDDTWHFSWLGSGISATGLPKFQPLCA